MRTIVLDTNVLIDNVHGYASWVDALFKREDCRLVVPTIVVAEYFAAQEVEIKRGEKEAKVYLSLFAIQELNFEIAEILGRISRRKTYPPGADVGDLIVASTTIYLGAELATRNRRHFGGIPDLRFFEPEKLKLS